MISKIASRLAGGIVVLGLTAVAITGCDATHDNGGQKQGQQGQPAPLPNTVDAVQGDASVSVPSKDGEIHLSSAVFGVAHAEQGGSCGVIGCGGSFSAKVVVDVKAQEDTDSQGKHYIDVWFNNIHCIDVQSTDPTGLAKLSWEMDKMPLPGYPGQAISGTAAVFSHGVQVQGTEIGNGVEFVIPDGAGELNEVQLSFSFTWSENDTTVHLHPSA